ncbi:hypothetical protein QOZ80_1BG0059190 [Eleusine coracana subsp. coracana]|nr:hypothetical protein QOZ80_1BG0059190 [Eleusine coracana subsp. coracana]
MRDPEFTVDFHVESSDNYGQFIANLRHRLANPRHFSHNRPVLPPVEPDDSRRRWFHVVLRTSTAALTLATRADNLYLEGFLSEDGTWWELTEGVIPGATYMGFGGSYRNLLGETDKLTGVTLGPQQMTEAVNVLAARVPAHLRSLPAHQQAKTALSRLLLMVHEATRFMTVSGLVAELMHPRAAEKSGTITAEMRTQVNRWKGLSAALLKADAQRPPGLFMPVSGMGVNTMEEAANTVGILLFVEVPACRLTADAALKLFHEG